MNEFDDIIKGLIKASLKTLQAQVEEFGSLDEKSVKTLETINKCVTELGKRVLVKPDSTFDKVTDEELESDF